MNLLKMDDINESEYDALQQDIEFLVHSLKESFESDDARYSIDELNDILYIELEGLQDYSSEEIVEIAEPLLDEMELEFEDILLLPLQK